MTPGTPVDDFALLQRAGRIAALQVSAALALVLLVVGAVVYTVDTRVQDRQINDQLRSVAEDIDDVTEPPPGMIVAVRSQEGAIESSDDHANVTQLLSGPAGLLELKLDGQHYRALVVDTDRGRVAALLSMHPYEAARTRLLLSLAVAAGAGVLASLAVVVVLTKRSIRPLAQALETQRRFVADVSHELRAPLTVLHTRAQLVAQRASATGQADLAAEAASLTDDTRALSDVIDDLLESATTIHPGGRGGVVDVASVVDDARRSMAGIAEAGAVMLTVDRQEALPVTFDVWGSGSALRRALVALIDNALAHQRPGGTVVLRLSRSVNDVSVAVIDDGCGIDHGAVGSLFTRFTTGDDTTEAVERRSHGIGLALVREIARAHGGDVRFTETPGGGATFTLMLPVVK